MQLNVDENRAEQHKAHTPWFGTAGAQYYVGRPQTVRTTPTHMWKEFAAGVDCRKRVRAVFLVNT